MNKTIIFLSFIIFSLLSFQYVNATLITSEAGTKRIQSIAIVIDENTYNQIKNEIDRFKIDIINDLSTEEIEIQIFLYNGSWESADELREYFRDLYTDYDLIGAILIGDVPTYYYLTPVGSSSYPNFPSDYPFADLDCELIDSDNDGLIENQNRSRYWGEITHREIWVSRIKPPINGSGGIALLRQYFDRNHQYRTGGLPYQQKVLVLDSLSIFDNGYTEEQYMERWETVINRTTLFDDSTLLYSNIPNELKQEYLNELKNPYEFGIAEIHGTPTKQIINIHVPSSESGRINYTEILETNTEILFYLLESCSNARFDQDNYLGGWYLFSGSGLWVFGLTTPQAVPSDIEGLNTIRLFSLSTGLTLGDIFKILTDNPGFVSLGDPTLTIRAPVTSPKIVTDQEIDFGGIEIDTQKEVMINISNVGSEKLIINQVYNMYELVGGDYCPPEEMTCAEPFYQTLHNLKEIEINETKTFGIKFMPTTLPGVYRGVIILITNDKDNPLFKIKLEGIGSGEGETLEIETEHVIEITPIDTKEIIIRKCPAGCTCTEETITCSIEEEM
ncbi:MAG: hypothetical protein KKC05_01285, partial [Nanoarchaeota archaeon]|nr:hypothetical protein [Nanoarchaeota archaeon]